MLYSLLVAVVIFGVFDALIVPFLVVKYFVRGYNISAERPIPEFSFRKKEKPEVDSKTAAILRNIDRYDGTARGQEVIE